MLTLPRAGNSVPFANDLMGLFPKHVAHPSQSSSPHS